MHHFLVGVFSRQISLQELSKSGGGRNFGRGRNLGRVRYMHYCDADITLATEEGLIPQI